MSGVSGDAFSIVASTLGAAGGLGAVAGLLTVRASRRKITAEATVSAASAADTITGSAIRLVQEREKDDARRDRELEELRTAVLGLRAEIDRLKAEVAMRDAVILQLRQEVP